MKFYRQLKTSHMVLIMLVIAGGIFGGNQMRESAFHQRSLNASYIQSINSAVKYLGDIEAGLGEARLTKPSAENAILFAEIWKQSGLAREALSSIPGSYPSAGEYMIRLNSVSEFSFEMMRKSGNGIEPDIEEQRLLGEMKTDCGEIAAALKNALRNNNGVEFSGAAITTSAAGLIKADENAEMFMSDPKVEIPVEEGVEIVKHFLRDHDIADIVYRGTTDREIRKGIAVYNYDIYLEGDKVPTVWMDLSRDGGYPVMMLKAVKAAQAEDSIKIEDAMNFGDEYLKYIGFSDMIGVDYELAGNAAIISYVPLVEGRLIYPDGVKLKVGVDNGGNVIMGFHATEYLRSHHKREFNKPKLSKDEALEFISEQFDIGEVRMAVIESDDPTGGETYCYEVAGSLGNENYLVYINADNGKREKALRVNPK